MESAVDEEMPFPHALLSETQPLIELIGRDVVCGDAEVYAFESELVEPHSQYLLGGPTGEPLAVRALRGDDCVLGVPVLAVDVLEADGAHVLVIVVGDGEMPGLAVCILFACVFDEGAGGVLCHGRKVRL